MTRRFTAEDVSALTAEDIQALDAQDFTEVLRVAQAMTQSPASTQSFRKSALPEDGARVYFTPPPASESSSSSDTPGND